MDAEDDEMARATALSLEESQLPLPARNGTPGSDDDENEEAFQREPVHRRHGSLQSRKRNIHKAIDLPCSKYFASRPRLAAEIRRAVGIDFIFD